MDSNKNKAALWEKCINMGIFENIHKDMMPRIQSTFENVDILNQECIHKIKEEISKLNTFEERQKEYDTLLNKAPPAKIDFSDKVDEPIQNIESLVERTQNSRQEIFKQLDTKPSFNQSTDSLAQIIKTQNNILIKILESQGKILEILQNKK